MGVFQIHILEHAVENVKDLGVLSLMPKAQYESSLTDFKRASKTTSQGKRTATFDATGALARSKEEAAFLEGGAKTSESGAVVKFLVTGRRAEQRSRQDVFVVPRTKAKRCSWTSRL